MQCMRASMTLIASPLNLGGHCKVTYGKRIEVHRGGGLKRLVSPISPFVKVDFMVVVDRTSHMQHANGADLQ